MKRLSKILLLLLPLAAFGDVVVPVEKVEQHVNIRMTPDAKSEIVGRLPQGEWRNVVDAIEGWYEVEIAGGATGFISADWTVRLDAPPAIDEAIEKPDEGAVSAAASVEITDETPASDGTEVPTDAEAEVEVSNSAPVESEAVAATTGIESEAETAESQDAVIADADTEISEPVVADLAVEEAVAEESVIDAEDIESVSETTEQAVDADADEADIPVADIPPGPTGPVGPAGPQGPPGPAGGANIEGSVDFLMKFTAPTIGGTSQVYDDGNHIGIGTTDPKQRLEVNGNIQIHEQNSSVAGLMITQSDGETGYIMHNRASTLTIGAGSVDRITIDRDGNVGFGTPRPAHPLELANGAHVTAGGAWTNASSRALKENIRDLGSAEALAALADLEPKRFNYRNDINDDYVGFIAEDVPDLVASGDRKGLSTMDIVAVLTRVVQDQQKKIEELEEKLDQR